MLNNLEIIPDSIKTKIMSEIIIPSYINEIKYFIYSRGRWEKISKICLTLTTLLVGLSSILAFISTNNKNYTMYAGICNVIVLMLKNFSSFCDYQDHVYTIESNTLLKNIGINITLPDLSSNNNDEENKQV